MDKTKRKAIGAAVLRIRRREDLTQQELASRVGIDQTKISRLERGMIDSPPPELLAKVASALGVDVEALESEPLAPSSVLLRYCPNPDCPGSRCRWAITGEDGMRDEGASITLQVTPHVVEDLPQTGKFCDRCGTELKSKCPDCGRQVKRKGAFCVYCGAHYILPEDTKRLSRCLEKPSKLTLDEYEEKKERFMQD